MSREIRTERLSARHRQSFLAAVRRSRKLHRGWVEPPATEDAYRAYLRRGRSPRTRQQLIVDTGSGGLVGVVNINEIVAGAFLSAYLGYFAFEPYAGQGWMEAGLREVVVTALRDGGLHRLEANIQPTNTRSLALIRRLGFRHEGFSPRYLKVAGRWRDHERFAITREDLRGRRLPAPT